MKTTVTNLKKINACEEGVKWFKSLGKKSMDTIELLELLVKEERLDWANWYIVRVMKRKQCLKYAIYAAEQVISIYEKKYPGDNRPRKAIQAAKAVLKKDNKKNRNAAYAAYVAAYAAADAAYVASYAAYVASYAAYAASYAASYAAADAARAAYAAGNNMKKRIIQYGIKLLKGKGA